MHWITPIFNRLAHALAWLGRQGPRAVAVSVIVALFVAPLSALLKPFLTGSVFLLLFIAFLRVDTHLLCRHVEQPLPVLAGTLWTALCVPALIGAACWASGMEAAMPGLYIALLLQAVASPMMSSPAFALFLGLDATLVLATLVTASAVTPLTASAFAYLFGLDVSPAGLGARLFLIVAGSALLAAIVRRLTGYAAIHERGEELDGVSILLLFVFLAAIMDNIGVSFLSRPVQMLALTAFAFAVFAVILVVSTLALMKLGRENALALGFMASQRNMGLMLAATGGAVPELAWAYFAVAQFPVYVSPYLLNRPVAWFLGRNAR